jgi:hypothetical protein
VTYAEAPRPDEAVPGGAADPDDRSPAEDAAPAVVGELAAAAAALGELDGLPVADHVARYDALHGELSEALAAIDGI